MLCLVWWVLRDCVVWKVWSNWLALYSLGFDAGGHGYSVHLSDNAACGHLTPPARRTQLCKTFQGLLEPNTLRSIACSNQRVAGLVSLPKVVTKWDFHVLRNFDHFCLIGLEPISWVSSQEKHLERSLSWLRVPIERSARLDWTWSGLIERRRACIASARSAFTFTTISNAFWKHRGKNSFTFTTISSAFWIEIVVNVKLFFPRCFQNASYFREKISSYFREKHESRSYYQPEKTASYYQPEKTAGIWLGKSVIRLLLTAFSRCIWLVALNEKSQLHSKLFSKC